MSPKANLSDYQKGFKNALMGMGVSEAEAERVALNQRDPKTPPERLRRTLSHVEIPVTPKRKSDTTPGPSTKRRRPGDDDDDDELINNMSKLRAHSTPSLPSLSKRRLYKRQLPPRSSRPSPTPSDTATILDDELFVISDEDTSDSDEEEDVPTVSQRSSSDSVKKADFKIVLTPTVYEIVKDFFRNKFIVQPDHSGRSPLAKSPKSKSHFGDPVSMSWGNVLQKEGKKIFYTNITMDGELYEVGDVVMVKPGDDWNRGRQKNYHAGASQSTNAFANQYWFIEISYFFQESDEKMFHGRWLEHGSKTFLQEVAHSKALFLTNTCDDVALSSIFQKVKVWFHRSNQPEPEDDKDDKGHTFFCEYMWDSVGFVDLPREEDIEQDLEQYPLPHQACHSCIIAEKLDAKRFIRHTKGCISQHDIDYHVHDFVYVKPGATDGGVLGIAQIIAISDPSSQPSLKVCLLHRMGRRPGSPFVEEKLLCFSTTTKTIPFKDIYGRVYVESFPSESREDVIDWSQHDDHFYVLSEMSQCSECMETHQQKLEKLDEFLARVEPLRGLELFSGAGGLSTGLNSSKFVKTVGAVEWDVHAAETYAANHPDTAVYCQEINEVLQHAIDSHEADGDVPPLRSRRGGFCKVLPREIDLISGGPPCQAFSGANHNPRADDMRATLPFTMISFLELYHSRYFLLENVSGILRFRLMGEMGETKHSIVAGVKHGVFKLIVRCLLALGYQVRVKVLQAANYGSPQGRERVIFWGAKHGSQIPNFPIPTHVYLAKEYNILEHSDLKLTKPTRSLDPETPHSFAPFKAVTVNDAIGDLPGFDWQNPHIILKATANEKEEERIREKMFPSFSATSGDCPGWKAGDYAHEPLNSYQELMREGMCDSVEEHVTPIFSAGVVERSVMIPLMPGAHHKDLPAKLKQEKKTKSPQNIYYRRLDSNGQFTTVMTHANPSTKGSSLLHPSQKRSITVREIARCQGFPDRYTFMMNFEPSEVRRAYKQIGNAVPQQLGLALGKSLGQAVIADWEKKEGSGREPTPDL